MSALSAAGRDTAPALSLRVTHVGANIIPLAVLFTPCEISNWKQQSDTTGGPDKAQSGGWRNVRNNTGGNKHNTYFYITIILGNNTKAESFADDFAETKAFIFFQETLTDSGLGQNSSPRENKTFL